ncbi:MAG: DUF2946 family protein [Roseovarius sp.]|nr:DUF2946 family protein [Roseovarius sp.]
MIKLRPGAVVSGLLAVVMAVQIATAFLPARGASAAETLRMVICGADGLRTVTVDPERGDSGGTPEPGAAVKCPFCVLAVGGVREPATGAAIAADMAGIRFYPVTASQDTGRAARGNYAIRAPPLNF